MAFAVHAVHTVGGRGEGSDQEGTNAGVERKLQARVREAEEGSREDWIEFRQTPGKREGGQSLRRHLEGRGRRRRNGELRLRRRGCGAAAPHTATTGRVRLAPDAGRRGLSSDNRCPSQREAANNGQHRFHRRTIPHKAPGQPTRFWSAFVNFCHPPFWSSDQQSGSSACTWPGLCRNPSCSSCSTV